jgi:amino acid adenylation domain-containing protein
MPDRTPGKRERGDQGGHELGPKELSGAVGRPSPLEVPFDTGRGIPASPSRSPQSCVLPSDLSDGLRRLSCEENVTIVETLLAAFQVLVLRYTSRDEFSIAIPKQGSGRGKVTHAQSDLFVPAHLGAELTFREVLRRTAKVSQDRRIHQERQASPVDCEEIHRSDGSSISNKTCLFMFDTKVATKNRDPLGSLTADLLSRTGLAEFNLQMSYGERSDGALTVAIEYQPRVLGDSTAEQVLRHFTVLLNGVVANPGATIARLPLIELGEFKTLAGWKGAMKANTRGTTVVQMFETQVQQTPSAVVIEFENQHITYDTLNRRANQKAHYFRSNGIRTETLVGICVDRSPAMIVALLGVLKAGAAYLPLDPTFPQDRLRFMIEDAKVRFIITERSLSAALPSCLNLLFLDSKASDGWPDSNPDPGPAEDDLAYAIYTSGSTGAPKGAAIVHRSLANLLLATQREPGLDSADVLLSCTTLSFDIAALEIFLPLVTGARVVLLGSEMTADAQALTSAIEVYAPTVMQATPSMWSMLVDYGWQGRDDLKILCGGELLTTDLAAELLERCGSLWNLYGPTETTIWSSVYRVNDPLSRIPIGRPIDNTTIYILDSNLEPVPQGIAGELFIGGAGVARGYLNRADQTSERFLADPFVGELGERFYRTGDLGRYQSNGEIQILGRLDQQVKFHGYRVELGEIESTIRAHEKIKDAVVVAQPHQNAGHRLVAYIVLHGHEIDAIDLRTYLGSRLPRYMIPSVFVALPTLPLTPNRKIDRNALPVPGKASVERNRK